MKKHIVYMNTLFTKIILKVKALTIFNIHVNQIKKYKLITTFIFSSFAGISQPVLTAVGINAVAGDVFNFDVFLNPNPGSAGANQTWNLTSTVSVMPLPGYSISSLPSAPWATIFANNSNIGMNDGSGIYIFSNATNASYQNTGIGTASSTYRMLFSDPEDLLRYPFSYNMSYTDNVVATGTLAGSPHTRTGSTTVTYDGYGTLIIPSGTYSNVARIHMVQVYNDTVPNNVVNYNVDSYLWYSNGYHCPLAKISNFVAVGAVTAATTTGQNNNYYTGGINILSGIEKIVGYSANSSVFPNPAKETINISFQADISAKEISIFDLQGNLVYSEVVKPENSKNVMQIRTDNLPDGLYTLKLKGQEETLQVKKISVIK